MCVCYNAFIISSLYELVRNGLHLQAVISAWKRYDLFMLRSMLCNHCLHARFAMVHLWKSFRLPICLPCKVPISRSSRPTSFECILVSEVWILIWMFPCDFPFTSSSKDLVKLPREKSQTLASANPFTKPLFWNRLWQWLSCALSLTCLLFFKCIFLSWFLCSNPFWIALILFSFFKPAATRAIDIISDVLAPPSVKIW